MTEFQKNEKYHALARYLAAYDVNNLPLLQLPLEDRDFLLEACLDKVPDKVKRNGEILYCPKCERQTRKNYDKYCSGCGKKLDYTFDVDLTQMVEVTEQTPYNQYGGRCFLCDVDTATAYVEQNCPNIYQVDVLNNIYTQQLDNKVWWKTQQEKAAHYKADRKLLVVYY